MNRDATPLMLVAIAMWLAVVCYVVSHATDLPPHQGVRILITGALFLHMSLLMALGAIIVALQSEKEE